MKELHEFDHSFVSDDWYINPTSVFKFTEFCFLIILLTSHHNILQIFFCGSSFCNCFLIITGLVDDSVHLNQDECADHAEDHAE